jgi:hypothetical protein
MSSSTVTIRQGDRTSFSRRSDRKLGRKLNMLSDRFEVSTSNFDLYPSS